MGVATLMGSRGLPLLVVVVGVAAAICARGQDPAPLGGQPPVDTPKAAESKSTDPFLPSRPAQDPAKAQEGVGATPTPRDLASRFRFVELYKLSTTAEGFGLSQYQVAFRETIQIKREQAQAAPAVQEIVRSGRYTERAAELGAVDNRMVSSVVRRYEAARVSPDPWRDSKLPPLTDKLTVWVKDLGGAEPAIVSLTPGRPLFEQEYLFALNNPYMPLFAYLLPEGYVRIEDRWALPRTAASALIGQPVTSGNLIARLSKVGPISQDTLPRESELATIDIEGHVVTPQGTTSLRAQVEFAFHAVVTPSSRGADTKKESDAGAVQDNGGAGVNALGGITKIRLAQVSTLETDNAADPGIETRRELIVERRWPDSQTELRWDSPLPQASAANSWLTYRDPKGRFELSHPPHYELRTATLADGADQVVLLRGVGGSAEPDRIDVRVEHGKAIRIDSAFEADFEQARQTGYDVRQGETRVLPKAEWGEMQVTQVEAILTYDQDLPKSRLQFAPRKHFDGYLMQLTENASVVATGVTAGEDAATFREELEGILKTFRMNP